MATSHLIPNGTTTTTTPPFSKSIPTIDFLPFTSHTSTPSERLLTAKSLVHALRTIGFVSLINHGVPAHELSQAFTLSRQFFDLPLSEKLKSPHPPGWAHHRGYSSVGMEKVSNATSTSTSTSTANDDNTNRDNQDEDVKTTLRSVPDVKESLEIGSPANPDQPNILPPPGTLDAFEPFMLSFYTLCHLSGLQILRAIAVGLDIETDTFSSLHNGNYNQLRLLHYPPTLLHALFSGDAERLGAHSDWSTITMLFQDDVGGLQVEDPVERGVWMDVEPVKGAVVLNVGDLLMRWSNDYLKSTQHRVNLPSKVNDEDSEMTPSRYSIPYFMTTDPDLVIECLRTSEDEPPKYEPITQRDYAAMRARMSY